MAIGTIWKTVATYDMPESTIAQQIKYVRSTVTINPVDYPTMLTNCGAWWDAMLADIWTNMAIGVEPRHCEVFSVDTANGDELSIGQKALVQDPSSVSDMIPHGVAGLITAKVLGGRGTAKIFWPAIQATLLDVTGQWNATAIADLADIAVEWLSGPADVGVASLVPATWNRAGLSSKDVGTVALITGNPAYQRRRRPGTGL